MCQWESLPRFVGFSQECYDFRRACFFWRPADGSWPGEVSTAFAAPAQKDPPSRAILIGVVLTIATAVAGFVVSLLQDQRKREIDFVDLQIERLYGPLFALSTATLRAKNDLIAKRRPGTKDYFDKDHPPSKADVQFGYG